MLQGFKNLFVKKENGIIVNENGKQIGMIKFNSYDTAVSASIGVDINKKNYTWEIDRDEDNFFVLKKKKYYIFNTELTRPVSFKVKNPPLIRPHNLNVILKSRVLSELNSITKGLFENVNWKMILFGLGIIAIIVYFLSGGTLV